MGKNLKFPRRGKFVAPDKKVEIEEKEITEEEHKARIEKLRALGLLK